MEHTETHDHGTKIGIGSTSPAKPSSVPEKFYPTLYLSDLSKDNPLIKKEVGSNCEACVTLKIVSKSEKKNGKFDVTLEVRDMWTRRS